MTHEFKHIVNQAYVNQQNGLKNVLATVVFLEGSSYRKPGVRMLIDENGEITGAVSGGCVEKEVVRRAQTVFADGQPKVMTYDGRYRLGCEGVLYILLEPFTITNTFLKTFNLEIEARHSFSIENYYQKEDEVYGNFGSVIKFVDNSSFTFSDSFNPETLTEMSIFKQHLQPCFKLLIIGGEHDAVKLCQMASLLGWDVDVVTSMSDPKQLSDFPGAKMVTAQSPELIEFNIDKDTAVVLMTHNYVQDLKFLLKLIEQQPIYIGILGSRKRKTQLENDLLHYNDDILDDVLDTIHSPAGLNIGAITPEEIAMSILSEILSVVRQTQPQSLTKVIK